MSCFYLTLRTPIFSHFFTPMQSQHPVATHLSSTSSFRAFLDSLLARFPERSQAIFGLRFGLDNGDEQTLEEIGKTYGITRERVRQVVDVMQKKMRTELKQGKSLEAINRVHVLIQESFGVITVDEIVERLAGKDTKEAQALLALLLLLPGVTVTKESDEEKPSLILADFDKKAWKQVVHEVATALKQAGDVVDFKTLYTLFVKQGQSDISESQLKAWIAPSKLVEENVFGQYGLADWDTIRPRGTRERAHLILKVFGKPLHFREIARLIDEHGLYKSGKKTHPQTVHNELIKDKRFVLVGRGTYALSDWGYTKGTVRQVLATILQEKAEPMSREELLKAVMKVRQVKKSTVIINLNTFFTKVGKNIYTLKESK